MISSICAHHNVIETAGFVETSDIHFNSHIVNVWDYLTLLLQRSALAENWPLNELYFITFATLNQISSICME